MKDDYLWDKTGEPDPEIQELEDVLGALRYQPRPLVIPAHLPVVRKQSHLSRFAIAAAVALMIAGLGLWTMLNRKPAAESLAAGTSPEVIAPTSKPVTLPDNKSNDQIKSETVNNKNVIQQPVAQPRHRHSNTTNTQMQARNNARARVKNSELTAAEQREAEAAKEQLFLALRVASSKLSLAQKRAQGTYPSNLIRNQHKVG